MTSSNGNIFRVTGHLCGEFTGPRWIPHTKASDAELWCFLLSTPNKRLSKQMQGWWFETHSPPLWPVMDCISNHRRLDCLLSCLFMRRSKKTSKLRVTGLSPVTGEFPTQRASNAKKYFHLMTSSWNVCFHGTRSVKPSRPHSLCTLCDINVSDNLDWFQLCSHRRCHITLLIPSSKVQLPLDWLRILSLFCETCICIFCLSSLLKFHRWLRYAVEEDKNKSISDSQYHGCWWPGNTRLQMAKGPKALQWRYNERNDVLNHRRLVCLFNRLFKPDKKKMSKLRITGLCEGNSAVTGEFPARRASNAENVSNWWRHHVMGIN